MKKQSLLLLAGGMLALASCQNEAAAPAAGPSEAQIDSMVNARVEAIRTELMASNDSLINALAQWKADSMIAAMKGGKPAAMKPKPVAKSKPGNNDFGGSGSTQAGTVSNKPSGIKGQSDQNAQSGLSNIKSQSDQNTKSGLKSIKDNADKK